VEAPAPVASFYDPIESQIDFIPELKSSETSPVKAETKPNRYAVQDSDEEE
jgi:hypothetical protein